MVKIKVAEASGLVLDWLVAKCEGYRHDPEEEKYNIFIGPLYPPEAFEPDEFGDTPNLAYYTFITLRDLAFSTDCAQGHQIIEREHINIRHTFTEGGYRTSSSIDAVHASIDLPNGATQYDPKKAIWEYGPTPLIAAMRCYVRSKFGEEVEVPEELLTMI